MSEGEIGCSAISIQEVGFFESFSIYQILQHFKYTKIKLLLTIANGFTNIVTAALRLSSIKDSAFYTWQSDFSKM